LTSYTLTKAAEADLRGIIRYTRKQWGDEQVRCYMGPSAWRLRVMFYAFPGVSIPLQLACRSSGSAGVA